VSFNVNVDMISLRKHGGNLRQRWHWNRLQLSWTIIA